MLMAKIKGKNTKPELALRKGLFRRGYRYRINVSTMIGSPDLVFPKYGAVIFVHGCFWHQHDCSSYKSPRTNRAFWNNKFKKNKQRDRTTIAALIALNWRVAIVWECWLTDKKMDKTIDRVDRWLLSNRKHLEIPPNSPKETST